MFCWILFSSFRGEVENISPIRGWGGLFSDRPKKKTQKLGKNVEILLSDNFSWIQFSGFRGEVENVSVNQRPVRSSRFSDLSEKHKLGRGYLNMYILPSVKFRWILYSGLSIHVKSPSLGGRLPLFDPISLLNIHLPPKNGNLSLFEPHFLPIIFS